MRAVVQRVSRAKVTISGEVSGEIGPGLMVLLGAPDAKIETVSLGEEKPRCNDSTEECYARNRRGDLLHAGEF